MRILVSRLRFLGDIVLSTPALDTLRERFPEARIEYLASRPHGEVLAGHPSVDRLHLLPARPGWRDLWSMVRTLREGPPIDWAFDLFSNPRSAVLMGLSGARVRVGADRGIRSRIYRHRMGRPAGDPSAIRHHLHRISPLVGENLPARRTTLAADPSRGEELLAELGLRSKGFTLVHPGSTWPDKAWPTDRWPSLLRRLDDGVVGEVRVLFPPGERDMARAVATGGQATLLPLLDVPSISALLPHARLYVGNDGGILHMAVAHRVPTVGLFGPTDPEIWFPYSGWGPYRVLHGCDPQEFDAGGKKLSRLGPISVEEVEATIHEVLEPAHEEGPEA